MGETLQIPYVAVVDADESSCRSLTRLLRAFGVQSKSSRSAAAYASPVDFGGGVLGSQPRSVVAPAAHPETHGH
jgi:hypothetical protein